MTLLEPADRHDGRRATIGEGLLRDLSAATVLDAADVHTAVALARLAGGADEPVQVAAALAVRAVRLGHVYVDLATVADTVVPDDEGVEIDLRALPWPDPAGWPSVVGASPLTAVGEDAPADRPLRLLGSRLYLDRYWREERSIAADLRRRAVATPPVLDAAVERGLDRLFPQADELQRLAATTALQQRFTVIAGGPGTGKTSTVGRIIALLHEHAARLGQPLPRVALAAPTGKAAARLGEAVHREAATLDTDDAIRAALLATPASTLHRLLGWQPGNRSRFRHDAANPLPYSTVIVDECSMVGLSMMAKLLAAVRPSARVILIGDQRQLASVEAGAVLGDIVSSPLPGIVVLRTVHRYGGGIARLADAIEAGDADAAIDALRASPADLTWLDVDATIDPAHGPELAAVRAQIISTATEVVDAARRGDGAGALATLKSVQVLCAHRRGPAGAARWRFEIERWLRAAIPGYGAGDWYPGRPLLVTENDHALGVYNGDTGVVVDEGGGRLRATFERRGEVLSVRPTRLAAVESLYAMTIHKSQGSQFGAVVVTLPEPTSAVLTRELLYTAVTRAQQRLTIIGSEAAIRAAVGRPIARSSGLADALVI